MSTTKTRWPSWAGRRSTSEPLYKSYQVVGLGGLLPIDTSVGDEGKSIVASPAKSTPNPKRRRPPNLTIVPPNYENNNLQAQSPVSANQNAVLAQSASSLLALVNDTLQVWSPTVLRPRNLSVHKPLPSRPRSISLPSSPDLPVELPGSILLENQGFPPTRPVAGYADFQTMRSVRSVSTLSPNARPTSSVHKAPQHKKSLSEASLKGHAKSRLSLLTATDHSLTTCSELEGDRKSSELISPNIALEALQPSPLIVAARPKRRNRECCGDQAATPLPSTAPASTTRNKRIEELKATITTQDQTISTLQAQFASLRASHEAHIASLADAHAAEVASLKNYTRSLEEQQQRSLHHASSNHLLFVLDTTDQPQTPSKTSSRTDSGSNSATSTRSSTTPFSPSRVSPRRGPLSPEMETLKRRLTTTRRPETEHDNLVRERDRYRNHCTAFEEQIERLTSKLNQVQEERDKYSKIVKNLEFAREEFQKKASKMAEVEKENSALQNTIDHLEYRLELANVQKIDAEEQLHNLNTHKSPFGDHPLLSPAGSQPLGPPVEDALFSPATQQALTQRNQSTRTSATTVFADDSPLYQFPDMVPNDLTPFVERLQQLQDYLHLDDVFLTKIQEDAETHTEVRARRRTIYLEIDQRNLKLKDTITALRQSGGQLLKEKTNLESRVQTLERRLDLYKLLLEQEIRRNAALAVLADIDDPHKDIPDLVSKKDVDRWVEQLHNKLKKAKAKKSGKIIDDSPAAKILELRKDIDFYVGEIILYKLDIRGYKSDIKKLKREALSYRSTGITSPPTSSTSTKRSSAVVSSDEANWLEVPISPGSTSTGSVSYRPESPNVNFGNSTNERSKSTSKRIPERLELKKSFIPQTYTPRTAIRHTEIDTNQDVFPNSVVKSSPEWTKPMTSSSSQEIFVLGIPTVPTRIQRPILSPTKAEIANAKPDTAKAGKTTPERPPRPSVGLFGVNESEDPSTLIEPPHKDILAEAEATRSSMSPEHGRKPSITSTTSTLLPKTSTLASHTTPSPIRTYRPRSREPTSSNSDQRRPSTATSSTTTTPFVIGMGSPHNPAFTSPSHTPSLFNINTPIATVGPAGCPITRSATAAAAIPKTGGSGMGAGLGGTMASTTPVSSPVASPTSTVRSPFFNTNNNNNNPASPPPSRSNSLKTGSRPNSRPSTSASVGTPAAGVTQGSTHSRSTSAMSIRSAMGGINLNLSFMAKGKVRKGSVGSISAPVGAEE